MGLLDQFNEFVKTPEGQGLLSAAFGGMATANRGQPINSLGKAGLAGIVGYGNAIDRQDKQAEQAFQNQYRQLQMGEIQRKMEEAKKREAMIATLPPEQQQALGLGVGFDKIWERQNPMPEKPQLVETADPNDPLRTVKAWLRPGESTGIHVGYGQMPEILDPRVQEAKAKIAAAGRSPASPPQPYYSPVQDATLGSGTFDHRTGAYVWPTQRIVKPSDSPELQGRIAGAKEKAKVTAEEQTKAGFDAPRVIDNATQALKYSDELLKHPGFGIAVGKSAMLGTHKIPGTPGYDFMNRLDQLKGGAFLEAFNTLKGGGQITEVEGKKATDAIARMDNATSEPEFIAAVRDYQDVIRKGMNRARMKAKPVGTVQQPQQGGVKFLGFE